MLLQAHELTDCRNLISGKNLRVLSIVLANYEVNSVSIVGKLLYFDCDTRHNLIIDASTASWNRIQTMSLLCC